MSRKEKRVKRSFVSINMILTSEVSVVARGRGLVLPLPQHPVRHSHLHISLMYRGERGWMRRCLLNEHFREGGREKAGKGEAERDMERGRKRDKSGSNHGGTNQTNNVIIMDCKETIMDHKGTIMDHNLTMDYNGIMDHNVTMDHNETIMDHNGTIMDQNVTMVHNKTITDHKGTTTVDGETHGTMLSHMTIILSNTDQTTAKK